MRKTLAVLLLGVSLTAFGDTSTKGDPKPGKGKPGDACKVNADCDQSGRVQSCVASKCQYQPTPPHPVPPPPT
jgi:hypothetical protein